VTVKFISPSQVFWPSLKLAVFDAETAGMLL
jgi:hypothetical protein